MASNSLDISLEQAVWTYHREGIDYGPFSSDEIIEQLEADELTREDVLLEHSANKVVKIEQVAAFLPALEASEERRWDQALDKETKRSFSEIRRGQQRRPMMVLAILLLSGGAGWMMFSRFGGSGEPGSIAFALAPATPAFDMEFAAFSPLPEPKPEVVKAEEKKRPVTKRSRRSTTGHERRVEKAAVPVVTTIDFSDPEVMNASAESDEERPAPLGYAEFQRYREELQPKLLNCIRNHNQKLVPGSYRVQFKIQRDGSASPARLVPQSAHSQNLEYCLNTLLRMNSLRAFTGNQRDLSLGFQVADP